jgi:hypothetical protein
MQLTDPASRGSLSSSPLLLSGFLGCLRARNNLWLKGEVYNAWPGSRSCVMPAGRQAAYTAKR